MNILLVDDDRTCLLSLAEGLRSHSADYQVFTAENGVAALQILGRQPVDLLITDLEMPEMNGFELLLHLQSKYPHVPVIVITAYGTPEIEKQIQARNAFFYQEKPLDFNCLVEKIEEAGRLKSRGFLRGISLPSFLQLVEIERKTCTLKIITASNSGYLYFVRGRLIDAITEENSGIAAALQIVAWDNATITMTEECQRNEQRIDEDLPFIILEGMRRKDERLAAGSAAKSAPEERTFTKEDDMNIKKLNEALSALQEDLGAGLVAADIFSTADSQAIAGINSNPKACALFSQITELLNKALKGSDSPLLSRYYLLDLQDNKMLVVMPMGDYQLGMMVDTKKAQLGMILNIVLPKVMDLLKHAFTE